MEEVKKVDFNVGTGGRRILEESRSPVTFMKALLSDVFPQQEWDGGYTARAKLFALFKGFSDQVAVGSCFQGRRCAPTSPTWTASEISRRK